MLFIVQFRDNPEKRDLRPKLMNAHLAFLKANDAKVRAAGSLRHEADDRSVGGMWMVEAQDFHEVRALYQQDPFWTGGLRASVEIHRFAKAFPDVDKPV